MHIICIDIQNSYIDTIKFIEIKIEAEIVVRM